MKNTSALRESAKLSLSQEDYRLAQKDFMQAIKLSPRLLPEVILDYEKEIEKHPEKIGIWLSLAGFKVQIGEIDNAILELEEALERHDKNIEAYNLLGKIYIKQERIDDVITLLEKSVKQGIKNSSLAEILAGAYLEKGRIKEATEFYNEVLKYRPGDKNILRVLGDLYARLEEYHKAAECYQNMFSDDPEVSREVIQRLEELLKKREGSVYIREILSDIYMKSLKPEEAIDKLKEIVRLDHTRLEDVTVRLKGVLRNYPSHPKTSLALAEVLRMQGNYSEASEVYRNLAKDNPDYMGRAVAGYQDILDLCPEQALARAYLAESYLFQKQVKSALQEFDQMVKHDPSNADMVIRRAREISKSQPQLLYAHYVLGRAYLAKGDLQRALVEAESILAVDKKFVEAYLLIGETYYQMKMSRKACETLRQALTIDPYNRLLQEKYKEVKEKELDLETNSLKEKVSQDQWKTALHLDLAKLYLQKGEEETAIRELQLALKEKSRAPFAYNLLGCVYRGQGRYDLAAAQFNRALEIAPKELADFSRSVKFNIGTTHEAQGQLKKALKIYESILQENIDFGNLKNKVKYLKSTSLQSMRNRELLAVVSYFGRDDVVAMWGREAKMGRSKKEEVSLSFGQTHNSAGYDLFLKGMYKAALEEFQLAVQLDSQFTSGLNNWAIALAKEGRFNEAKAKLEKVVDISPNSPIFRNNLGLIYLILGHLKSAKKEIEKAYALDPNSSVIAINLGDACYLKGDTETAIKLYQKVGRFDIVSEIAERRLIHKTSN